jgi:hypothetical protein
MASCGTTSGYRRGGPDGKGCRCDRCKEAYRDARRELRQRSVHERTKTRKPSNVVTMRARPAQQPQVATQALLDPIGNEAAVIERLAQLNCEDPSVIARCRSLARTLDNDERPGMHVQAAKALDEIMVRVEGPVKRKKSNAGKLAIMNSMNRPGRRAAAQ